MNGPTRKRIYAELVIRDGEYCRGCGKLPHEGQLVVDHRDNDTSNDNLNNYQLLCRRCNYLKNPRRPFDKCVSENEIHETPSEIEINKAKEPKFREYVYWRLNEKGMQPFDDLVFSGAEFVGIASETAKRYLNKMCSLEGALMKFRYVETVVVKYKHLDDN